MKLSLGTYIIIFLSIGALVAAYFAYSYFVPPKLKILSDTNFKWAGQQGEYGPQKSGTLNGPMKWTLTHGSPTGKYISFNAYRDYKFIKELKRIEL